MPRKDAYEIKHGYKCILIINSNFNTKSIKKYKNKCALMLIGLSFMAVILY